MTTYRDPFTLEEAMREIRDLRKQVAKYKEAIAQQGEPVAIMDYKSPYMENCIRWTVTHRPPDGTKLYTSAPSIPEGWQLMPTTLRANMYRAAVDVWSENRYFGDNLKAAYKAMLSAVPSYKGE